MVMMLTTLELMGSNSMCLIIMQQQMEIFLPQNGAVYRFVTMLHCI